MAEEASVNPIKDCGEAPHCVSTVATDKSKFIQPIIFNLSKEDFIRIATATIESMDNAKIVKTSDTYIHAEFTSSIMKFVDDFEVYYDAGKKMIDMRSTSRIGYYDFNVNLKRSKTFEKKFLENVKK